MKFADKMKDVEMHPYMLAIYKDNKYHHLLLHAIESWKIRKRGLHDPKSKPVYFLQHPIIYVQFPPIELIDQYEVPARTIVSSKHIQCPVILKQALLEVLQSGDYIHLTSAGFWLYTAVNVTWDDELIFEFARADLSYHLLKNNIQLTEEQRSVLTICA